MSARQRNKPKYQDADGFWWFPSITSSPILDDPIEFVEELMFHNKTNRYENTNKLKYAVRYYWDQIRTSSVLCVFEEVYTIRLETDNLCEIHPKLWLLYENQRHDFKINIGFGFIEERKTVSDSILFYSSGYHEAARFLENPDHIICTKDFECFLEKIDIKDITAFLKSKDSDIQLVTNVDVCIDKCRSPSCVHHPVS